MKTSIKSVIVLTLICLVVSGILSGINFFTGPIIKEYESRVAYEACYKVMPDASTFEEINVDNLPKTVTNVYKETTGKGYVFKMETTGYSSGLVIMCGITSDGKITKVTTVSSNETPSIGGKTEEDSYTNQYIGKDSSLNGVVGISGATMTSNAYKAAIADAFTAFDMINGGAL